MFTATRALRLSRTPMDDELSSEPSPDTWDVSNVSYSVRTAGKFLNTRVPDFLEAWGNEVRKHLFIIAGKNGNANYTKLGVEEVPQCAEDHEMGLVCKEATQLKMGSVRKLEWLFVGDDDLYVHTKNLARALQSYDSSKRQILGIPGCGDYGLCGGGGYAISRAALDKFISGDPERFVSNFMDIGESWVREGKYPWSDQITAKLSKMYGIEIRNLPGLYGWKFKNNIERERAISSQLIPLLSSHYVDSTDMLFLGKYFKSKTRKREFTRIKNQAALLAYQKAMHAYVIEENQRRASIENEFFKKHVQGESA